MPRTSTKGRGEVEEGSGRGRGEVEEEHFGPRGPQGAATSLMILVTNMVLGGMTERTLRALAQRSESCVQGEVPTRGCLRGMASGSQI